jgi:hypothetical protein
VEEPNEDAAITILGSINECQALIKAGVAKIILFFYRRSSLKGAELFSGG